MKKILILILVTVMAFSMVACGSEANESSKISGEGTVDSQPVDETNEGDETSSENIVDNQPVDGVAQSFDFKTLSSYSMPEPSFGYSYKFYEETMQGMGADGEPILLPKFTFEIDTDRVGAHEYMGQVKDAGWGGDIPYLTQEAGGAFWYVAENENYKINLTWDDDTNIGEITIINKTKSCIWDNTKSFYIIDDVNEYDSYAPYRHAQSN